MVLALSPAGHVELVLVPLISMNISCEEERLLARNVISAFAGMPSGKHVEHVEFVMFSVPGQSTDSGTAGDWHDCVVVQFTHTESIVHGLVVSLQFAFA